MPPHCIPPQPLVTLPLKAFIDFLQTINAYLEQLSNDDPAMSIENKWDLLDAFEMAVERIPDQDCKQAARVRYSDIQTLILGF